MVFASLTFLYLFLPALLLCYYAVRSTSWKNGVLILFSLLFYAWGEPVWVSLLLISAGADYLHGRIIESHRGRLLSRLAVVSSLVVNLGLLAIFKYSTMMVEAWSVVGELVRIVFVEGPAYLVSDIEASIDAARGSAAVVQAPQFSLPIGISFYTFQTISYTVDVYRGEVPAQRSFWKFLLFVSLFHQLVAGPIVRYREIHHSIEDRRFDVRQFGSGVTRFAVGLAKKVLIANAAGELAVPFLDQGITALSVAGAWYGVFLFGLQIYFDFSGYSDMAIGLGRMFGFEYRENFRYPYAARSASEFWRRWHISLGSFFRDYLYIPLGGNRRRVFRNLMIVWFLTGLWHGASWNFVLWGLYYGILIYGERVFRSAVARARKDRPASDAGRPGAERLEPRVAAGTAPVDRNRRQPPSRRSVLAGTAGHLYLVAVTLLGWTIFYFTDTARLISHFAVMFGSATRPFIDMRVIDSIRTNLVLLLVATVASLPVVPWVRSLAERVAARRATATGGAESWPTFTSATAEAALNVVLLALSTILLVGAGYNPFLYFRF